MENMKPVTLKEPTISELISALQQFPPTQKVIIQDTDTGWTIDTIHIVQYTPLLATETAQRVELFGKYNEMDSSKP